MRVMAAGVNYNGVWASLGLPVSIFRYTGYDFHIAGSDASGIVERVGPGVTRWKPGDEVVIHCNQSCGECAECNGLDPMACSRQKIWAYESNWGSFAEYCLVQAQQLLPKPRTADVGGGRVVRPHLLHRLPDAGRPGRASRPATTCSSGAPAAAWGRSPSSSARSTGRTRSPSSRRDDKVELVRELGAAAVLDRREFALADPDTGERNFDEIKRFGKARSARLTGGVDCDIVFEHVGAATFFTSVFVCRTFGTIVICGATSGFQLDFDVRYLWMRQKTIIGSHFANAYECQRANQLIAEGKIQPVLSRVFPFAECPVPHQMMKENQHVGKMVVLVGRRARGRGPAGCDRAPLRRRRDDVDPDYARDLGDPGEFPFTRGIHRDMYAGRPWSIRQYAGFGTAEETNRRFRFLIDQGQPALSTAFDLPTQMGLDSDDPRAEGEVGRVGVAIDSVRDMEAMFDGIPLDEVSTSMTINAPAAVLVAMYYVACERQGRDPAQHPRHGPERRAQGVRRAAAPTSTRRGRRCGWPPT